MKVTPYQQLKASRPVRLIRENKLLTGVAAVGIGLVVAGGAAQSTAFANAAQYGLVPALGVSLAGVLPWRLTTQ